MAVATAVLTGALLVGDSVRGSLEALALEGLGDVTFALRAPRMVRQSLATDIEGELDTSSPISDGPLFSTYPSILLRGSLNSGSTTAMRHAGDVRVIGWGEHFWRRSIDDPDIPATGPVIALTQTLADELNVTTGEYVVLQVPSSATLPAESLLGDKETTIAKGRLKVVAVLPPTGLARFSLTPSQHLPRNAFVPLDALQDLVGAREQINTILIESERQRTTVEKYSAIHASRPAELSQLADRVANVVQPKDYGLQIERVFDAENQGPPSARAGETERSPPERSERTSYINISSDALILQPLIVKRLTSKLKTAGLQPSITYLANTITVSGRTIPYSLVTGIESTEILGPLYNNEGGPLVLATDEIVLNDWAAEQLRANVGDTVTIRSFEPESRHGEFGEHGPVSLTLRAVAPLETPGGQPTKVADPYLTPQLEGVTDQESISNWEVPFPLVETIRPEDEAYWTTRSTTPKAFVSMELATSLWSSRYGSITSIRIPMQNDASLADVTGEVRSALDPAELGFIFEPVREQALAAASGTTPFDMLFLGFSMYLIAAAVMLIALLFRLGVQLRAEQIGLLAAVGVPARRVRQMLVAEASVVAVVGAAVGIAAGVSYAALMLLGLRTLWLKAIATPFITLHVWPWSLVFGWLLGLVAAIGPCYLAIRSMIRVSPGRLLSGATTIEGTLSQTAWRRWPLFAASFLIFAAIGLGMLGAGKTGEAQAGAFFGAGAAVLAAALLLVRYRLSPHDPKSAVRALATLSMTRLAARSARRNPGRSLLCIGLVAAASFLIVAISAFRLGKNEEGAGRFELLAETDVPLQYNLATSDGRIDLGFSDEDDERLQNVAVFSFRVRDGDDASCLNLYQTRRPRILGVPDDFIERGGFAWADAQRPESSEHPRSELPGRSADGRLTETRSANPWSLLNQPLGDDENGNPIVPVILDADTAAYNLKLGGVGARLTIDDPAAGAITFKIVGLLKKSMLQGVLLVSEERFLDLYPQSDGYRYFLVDCPEEEPADRERADITTILESTLRDFGFDATSTVERLNQLYDVQNTYLSTFQTLGGLGLLLGTFGLAAIELRSVVERRAELALMRAVGFRGGRLAWMVLAENAALLLVGVGVGTAAAAVALLPHWIAGGAAIPWAGLAGMLLAVVVIGLVAGAAAVRAALRTPLMATLRGD